MKRFPIALAALAITIGMLNTSARAQTLSGSWNLSRTDSAQNVHLELRLPNPSGGYRDESSHDLSLNELGLTLAQVESAAGNHVTFALRREAGTVQFDGWLQSGSGGGHFTFGPNTQYVRAMQSRGYTLDDPRMVLAAAVLDLSSAYVERIRAAGYGGITFEKLIAFRALGIDTPYIAQMRAHFHNVDDENIISLRALGVTDSYLSELRSLGFAPVTAEEAVELRALHIDAAYVRDLASAGYSNLSAHDLVELKALGIDSAYIRRVEAHGFHHLSVGKLVETKAMGVI